MKAFTLALMFLAFGAHGATLRLTIDLENIDASSFKKAHLSFKSSNPLCKKLSLGGPYPIRVDRKKSTEVSFRKLSNNRIEVEASTIDPKNDMCNYRFEGLSVSTQVALWAAVYSTRTADYDSSDAILDVVKNPSARNEVVCRKNSQCQKYVNGAKAGYASTAVVFYADQKSADSKSGAINAHITIRQE